MRRVIPVFIIILIAGGAAVPAWGHEHPSGLSDLVTPAIVRIEATSHVEITLLDHAEDLRQVKRTYDVPIGTGTGTVISPDGAAITMTEVVKPDKDVAVYAVNRIFADHHDVAIPDDFERHKLKNENLDRHLQECYPPETSASACIIQSSTEILAFPNVIEPAGDGTPAEIASAGKKAGEPAVLTIATGEDSLPTAPLAQDVPRKAGSPIALAGFSARPSATRHHSVDIGHLTEPGRQGRTFEDPEGKTDEPKKIGKLAASGFAGAPVIGNADGKVVGLLTGDDSPRLTGIREIKAALAKAEVTPRRGGVDDAFEVALAQLHTRHYGNAVPAFERVLELYPGHVVAAQHHKTALAKRGTAEDESAGQVPVSTSSGGMPWLIIGAAVAAALLLAGGGLLVWRRRPALADDRTNLIAVPQHPRLPLPEPVEPERRNGGPPSDGEPGRRFCVDCGMRLGATHRFCAYCGHPAEM